MGRSSYIWAKARSHFTTKVARFLFVRPFKIHAEVPLISFTFDDFPRSALLTGGTILQNYGLRGSYYASFGLMGKEAPPGPIFLLEDLKILIEQGHELGCHTFGHCHSAKTSPSAFEEEINKNRLALHQLIPETMFQTFSYPLSEPRPGTKRRAARHFLCCRGGGQTFNSGTTDLNRLSAYFLEQSRHDPDAIKAMIDKNRLAGGWLIFATHDIRKAPSRWGCTPAFFEDIVQYAINSGARILPVAQALGTLSASMRMEHQPASAGSAV